MLPAAVMTPEASERHQLLQRTDSPDDQTYRSRDRAESGKSLTAFARMHRSSGSATQLALHERELRSPRSDHRLFAGARSDPVANTTRDVKLLAYGNCADLQHATRRRTGRPPAGAEQHAPSRREPHPIESGRRSLDMHTFRPHKPTGLDCPRHLQGGTADIDLPRSKSPVERYSTKVT